YYRTPRKPGPADIRLMELTARFLGVVIERSRQEAEAHEKQRALAHLGRGVMLGELTGTLAHELNQPLTVILSQAEAGLRMLERQPTQLDFIGDTLRDIVEADRRASHVIRRLRSML